MQSIPPYIQYMCSLSFRISAGRQATKNRRMGASNNNGGGSNNGGNSSGDEQRRPKRNDYDRE